MSALPRDENFVPIQDAGGTVSESNSSTTALNNSEVFTGEWENVGSYDSLVVSVATDQNGTYTIQFSPDGVNVDSTLTRYYRTNQINVPHRFTITRKFARVVFTNNSGSNQTYFRLQTLYGAKNELNTPIDSVMSQDFDSISVRPTDFLHEVALSRRQGYSLTNKFGYNEDVDTATDPEVIAAFGGSFTPLTTASTLTIVSSDTADDGDPGGTGARTILVSGLDANRDEQVELVTLDGTTNVVTTSTWLGVNRAVVTTSGTGNTNAGTITITATTGGSTQATIPAGGSVTQQLIYFTPRNHTGLIESINLSAQRFGSGTEPVLTFKGWVYSGLVDTKYEIYREILNTSVDTRLPDVIDLPLPLTEQDVFWIEAETTRDNTSVSGRFSVVTVRDVDA